MILRHAKKKVSAFRTTYIFKQKNKTILKLDLFLWEPDINTHILNLDFLER